MDNVDLIIVSVVIWIFILLLLVKDSNQSKNIQELQLRVDKLEQMGQIRSLQ